MVSWSPARTPLAEDLRRFVDGLVVALTQTALEATVLLDPQRTWLDQLDVTVRSGRREGTVRFTFSAGPVDLPALPEAARRAPAEPRIPAALLLVTLPRWGWSSAVTHGPWAQAAIDLAAATDQDGRIAALYAPIWASQRDDDGVARTTGLVPSPGARC